RFDRIRRPYVRYLLYGHARGTPSLTDPHVLPQPRGQPAFPGNTILGTRGLWQTVKPVTVAGTTMHELGHTLNLHHGGAPPVWDFIGQRRIFEVNCKTKLTPVNVLTASAPARRAH